MLKFKKLNLTRVPMKKISLLVVDDHPLFRQGVVDTLTLEADMDVLGQASSGEEALRLVRELRPQVVVMDINMPGLNGLQITHLIIQDKLPVRVLLLTGYDEAEQAVHAALAGAAGYLAKDVDARSLLGTIRDVAAGRFVFDARVLSRRDLEEWLSGQTEGARRSYSEPGNPFHPLSEREMQVLNCMVRGMSNKEIAGLLDISHQTVKNHVTSVLRKFGVEDRTQAVIYAIKRGWVTLKDANKQERSE
ncbi:MAG: DNA-binding response regulator [Anaerolineae bacterium]|nr:Transcriptional regulatory protein DegU [Anaerolineales bacterium]MCQ3945815.1 DNA-binding response regulator [Anaerolineae bacterium]RIK25972.1 MAG: DNA-binding response regulator [Anaerolineae bacterium]GER81146.1 DNA-binding response regulator [Candidatus Denitrolinea symbiosum]